MRYQDSACEMQVEINKRCIVQLNITQKTDTNHGTIRYTTPYWIQISLYLYHTPFRGKYHHRHD